MMVPKKMANRCQAFSPTPAGIGENQIITDTRTVAIPRKAGFFLRIFPSFKIVNSPPGLAFPT